MESSPELQRGLEEVRAVTAADEEESALVASVEWLHRSQLRYTLSPAPEAASSPCFNKGCGNRVAGGGSGSCAKCKGAFYCSRECQTADWKRGHKRTCDRTMQVVAGTFNRAAAVVRLLRRIRLYLSPFAIANEKLGPGVVLVQSPNTLEDFALLEATVSPTLKQIYARSVILNYITAAEFKGTIAKDDAEMVPVAAAVEAAIEALNTEHHHLVLLMFRCGALELAKCPWVPAKAVCRALAADFEGKGCVQLNLEEE
jgi:hypothetical protein